MKQALLLLFLAFGPTLSAQSDKFMGNYASGYETDAGEIIEYRLTLNPNRTFLFHSYRKEACDSCKEENKYGKGEWKTLKNSLVYLYADKDKDLDATYTLNLNNSKARYNSKSPRDKSDRIIKTSLIFYDSDLSLVRGLELFKKE